MACLTCAAVATSAHFNDQTQRTSRQLILAFFPDHLLHFPSENSLYKQMIEWLKQSQVREWLCKLMICIHCSERVL